MELLFTVKKTPDFVFDYLTDMRKFVSVHPVITKIDPTGNNSYLVHEKLRFVFIPIAFTYPVIIEKNLIEKTVIMYATVMKYIKIKITFRIKQENNVTFIKENVTFKSPLPLTFFMRAIFRKQHLQLFKNIELIKS
jgi:carbon monoxide dehydrogenase subunit G